MFAFPGKKGNCEFNFCICTWLYVVCTWLTLLLRSFKCDCGKNSQFAIIRLSHLKSVLRYIIYAEQQMSLMQFIYYNYLAAAVNILSFCERIGIEIVI